MPCQLYNITILLKAYLFIKGSDENNFFFGKGPTVLLKLGCLLCITPCVK